MFMNQFDIISHYGHEVTLWVLVVLSIVSIAFILERFFTLRKAKTSSDRARHLMAEALQSNTLTEIEDLSRDRESLEGRALSYGLRHAKTHKDIGLEEVFNSYAQLERPRLEKHLNFLATVGSNAPFIGLLGTVFGIMDAFRALASSHGEATVVMLGISKALVATGIGLLVAIPAVISFNYFQRQVRSIMQGLDSIKDLCLAIAKTGTINQKD